MKVSINYTGGGHGNFLEHACNYIFLKQGNDPNDRVTTNGTYHKSISGPDRQFIAFPFWWVYPNHITHTWPKIPYPLEKTVIHISSESLEEITLLRMYWRRRGDGFFLSPLELLNITKQSLIKLSDSIKYPIKWIAGEVLARTHRKTLLNNALSMYKNETLDEMTLIRFWMNPFKLVREADHDWMVNTSAKFIEHIKPNHNVIEFKMKWFYNPEDFLSGIKMIGNTLGLVPQVPDEEIIDMVKVLPKNTHELPKNLSLVREKFEAIKRNENVDLSMLELNDKIALLTMIDIEFKVYSRDYEHMTEFPKTSDKLVEIINNRVIAV